MTTSFPKLLNAPFQDRAEIIHGLTRYPLLIIDDLGVERTSEFSVETVYLVIDERYKSGKPTIITTNLTLEQLRNPSDVSFKRIFSRVLEMCVPAFVKGPVFRDQKSAAKMARARELFSHA